MKSVLRLALWALVLAVLPAAAGDAVRVHDAWVREAPPVARALAGYMQIENTSGAALNLVGAESPAFERVEIHRTEMHDGVAHMVRQDQLAIPAGQRVELKPGGLHLMLIGPKQALPQGSQVDVQLQFDTGQTLDLVLPVKRVTGDQPMSHHHH